MSRIGPDISVVTATRNRGELLRRKLASLEAQTLPAERFEWIVCDDAGDDGSAAMLRARRPPFRLSVLRLERRRGAASARNACARIARGRILYLSDDDCLPAPDTLERHLAAQERPCVAVGALRFEADGAAREWRPRRARFWNVNGANTSLPSSAFRAVGGFDETLAGYGGEDLLLGYLLARSGLAVRALPDAAAVHLGPPPFDGSDLAKAESAGANAAAIAQRHPQLALRLGVHPLLLGPKLLALPLLLPALGGRGDAELAYARGAWRRRRSMRAPLRGGDPSA